MNTFPVILGALCVYAIAYRYYSAFIAAKVLALDDRRLLPRTLLKMDTIMSRRRNLCCSGITLRRLRERDLLWVRHLPHNLVLLPDSCGS